MGYNRAVVRRWVALGVVGLVMGHSGAQGGAAPDLTRPPNVIVVIQVQPDGLHPISWTFDKRVPHSAVRERIQRFAQYAGRGVAYIEIADDSLKRNAQPRDLLTVASFASGGLVDLKEGTLNLTPLVRTFADTPIVHIYVLLPHQVQYAGYRRYVSPHLEMWTHTEPQMWRSVINIHTPDPALLEIPLKRPQPQPQTAAPPMSNSRPPTGWSILLILFAALLAGAGIFWLSSKLLRRQTESTTVQPETDL